jgi:cell division protein FtsW
MAFSSAKSGHRADTFLMALLALLVLGGLVILASASSELGRIKFGDSYYYLKHQTLYGFLPGAIGFIICFFFPYQNLKKIALPFFLFNLALLALVFTKLGITSGGASRWLEIGPISFQPAELLKVSFILYLSAWLGARASRAASFWGGFLPFLVACGVMAGMLVVQPATSTVVILLISGGTIYFLSGAKWKYVFASIGLAVLILVSLVYFTPYRMKRITGFLDKTSDTQGANYHVNQALIAIGSGGALGMGYGKSTAKVNYLPAVIDDSIFAVVGQELGFAGTGLLTVLFGMLVFRLFWLAMKTHDRFGKNILVGFGSVIALQSLVNMGAMSGLLPLTGVPLPFISYGGTALAIFMVMGGISLNISKYAG